jgi:hypothetical protein
VGSLPLHQDGEFEAQIMGARTEEMGSETLRPLPDLRARALVKTQTSNGNPKSAGERNVKTIAPR